MAHKNKGIIAIDAGGTSLKWTLICSARVDDPISRDYFRNVPIDSRGLAENIIGVFVETIETGLQKARALNLEVSGIGVSVPGPFDFRKGISLLKHKYQAIYGMNLRSEFIRRLRLAKDFPIKFEHDVDVFLIGETCYGAAKGCNRVIGVTIGSGLGSAFMVDNKIAKEGKGVPPAGSMWCLPHEGEIVDDRISHRGILSKYRELGGKKLKNIDVEIISKLAAKEDKVSLEVFKELGISLGKIIKPIASEFEADCIVFGGQISKSFSLFSGPLKRELESVESLKKVSSAARVDLAPLYGVAKQLMH